MKKPFTHWLKDLGILFTCLIFVMSCADRSTFESEFQNLKDDWIELESTGCDANNYYNLLSDFNKNLNKFKKDYYTNEKLPNVSQFFKEFHDLNLTDVDKQLKSISRSDNPENIREFKFKNIDKKNYSCLLASSLLKSLKLSKKEFKEYILTTYSKNPHIYSNEFKEIFNHFANLLLFGDSAETFSRYDSIGIFYEASYFKNLIVLNGYFSVKDKLPFHLYPEESKKEMFANRVFSGLLSEDEFKLKNFEYAKDFYLENKELITIPHYFRGEVSKVLNNPLTSKEINQLIEMQIAIDTAQYKHTELTKTINLISKKEISINRKTYNTLLDEYSLDNPLTLSMHTGFYNLVRYGYNQSFFDRETANDSISLHFEISLDNLLSNSFGVEHLSNTIGWSASIQDKDMAQRYLSKYFNLMDEKHRKQSVFYEEEDFIAELKKNINDITRNLDSLGLNVPNWIDFPSTGEELNKIRLTEVSDVHHRDFQKKIESAKSAVLTGTDSIYLIDVEPELLKDYLIELSDIEVKEILLTLKVIYKKNNIDYLFKELAIGFLNENRPELFRTAFIILNDSIYRDDISYEQLPELKFTNKIRTELYNQILNKSGENPFNKAASIVGGCSERNVKFNSRVSTRNYADCLAREFKLVDRGIINKSIEINPIEKARELFDKASSNSANMLRARLLYFAGEHIPKEFTKEIFLSLKSFDSDDSSTKRINKTSMLIVGSSIPSNIWTSILSRAKLQNI